MTGVSEGAISIDISHVNDPANKVEAPS